MRLNVLTITGIVVLFFLGLACGSLLYEHRIYPKLAAHKLLGKLPFTILALLYFILWVVLSLVLILPLVLVVSQQLGSALGVSF